MSTLPKRLKELVIKYPYAKQGAEYDGILPKPRFTTRAYPALLVQLTRDRSADTERVHPVSLIEDALRTDVVPDASGALYSAWDTIKLQAKVEANGDVTPTPISPGGGKPPTYALSQIFADETLNALSLIPLPSGQTAAVSIFSMTTPGFSLSRPPPPQTRLVTLRSHAPALPISS